MTDLQKMLTTAMNDPSATPEQSAAIAQLLQSPTFGGQAPVSTADSGGNSPPPPTPPKSPITPD